MRLKPDESSSLRFEKRVSIESISHVTRLKRESERKGGDRNKTEISILEDRRPLDASITCNHITVYLL